MALLTALLAASALIRTGFPNQANTAPQPIWPGFGVNIHFTDTSQAEFNLFKRGGFQYARMDFSWESIETSPAQYNFSAYDRLHKNLSDRGIRPLFILGYGNKLYQEGAPSTPQSQTAFAQFAAAAAEHFKGKEILWEIWNEPNLGQFWQPSPSPESYQSLALKTSALMKQADPSCRIIVGATSTMDYDFLTRVLNRQLLSQVDGVSVHPYRTGGPESVWNEYGKVRGIIETNAPESRKNLPIICSEWGYSTYAKGVSEGRQAMYLVRSWLINAAAGVPVSIYYDWKDDGPNPNDNEHRFGIVTEKLKPKPSFYAAQYMLATFAGCTNFRKAVTNDPLNWVIEAAGVNKMARASWYQKEGNLPKYEILKVSDGPKMYAEIMGHTFGDRPPVSRLPMTVAFAPPIDEEGWCALIKKPTADSAKVEFRFKKKDNGAKVTCFATVNGFNAIETLGASDIESEVSTTLPGIPSYTSKLSLLSFNPNDWQLQLYSENTAQPRTNLIGDSGVSKLTYQFPKGWQYITLVPKETFEIPAKARQAVIWVKSDQTGNMLRSRFRDETGQVFQVDLGRLDEEVMRKGMKAFVIPLDGTGIGTYWGGSNDGKPSGKLFWDALLLIDSAKRETGSQGTIEFGPIAYEL